MLSDQTDYLHYPHRLGAEQSQPALELSKLGRNIALRAGQNFRMFQLAKQKLGGCATKDREGKKFKLVFQGRAVVRPRVFAS